MQILPGDKALPRLQHSKRAAKYNTKYNIHGQRWLNVQKSLINDHRLQPVFQLTTQTAPSYRSIQTAMAEPIDTSWSNRGRDGDNAAVTLPPSYSTTCRSCRGLLFYAPVLKAGVSGLSSASITAQPLCIGLSSAAPSSLSVERIHAARQIPQEHNVSYLLILGHSVFKADITREQQVGDSMGLCQPQWHLGTRPQSPGQSGHAGR